MAATVEALKAFQNRAAGLCPQCLSDYIADNAVLLGDLIEIADTMSAIRQDSAETEQLYQQAFRRADDRSDGHRRLHRRAVSSPRPVRGRGQPQLARLTRKAHRGLEDSIPPAPARGPKPPSTPTPHQRNCVMPKSNRPGSFGQRGGTVTVIEQPVMRSLRAQGEDRLLDRLDSGRPARRHPCSPAVAAPRRPRPVRRRRRRPDHRRDHRQRRRGVAGHPGHLVVAARTGRDRRPDHRLDRTGQSHRPGRSGSSP